jgi:hypothetical protein
VALALFILKVKLDPRRKETDCAALERDLVAGSLSGVYGRNRKGYLSVFQVSG